MTPRYHIEWAPVAIQDFDQILAYVSLHDSPQTAVQIYTKISSRIKTLCNYPRRCRIVPELKGQGIPEYRELIIAPYRVFFRLTERTVGIVGVLDGRRDLEELIIQRALDR